MITRFILKWLLVISLVAEISSQEQQRESSAGGVSENLTLETCKLKDNCGDCIAAHASCAWCKKENYTEHRCDLITTLMQSDCSGDIDHPKNVRQQKKEPRPFSGPGARVDDVVQVVPQEVHLKLRPHAPYQLDVHFQQAEDYPVDLYYLMDLSKSMEDDKDKLASLGTLLADHMSSITRNFRLGFGSFVDKTVMPYVSTVPSKLKAPCTNCAAPYGFKNHMPLHENTSQFSEEVRAARVSGNLDAPEGGFDAIMQSIVCHREIRWREKSRKILVFSTDSGFHYAGDGKLGGIVTPNDGRCHLDDNGSYTESINQDYPSLSQIRQKISEKKINIIFAVTAGQVPVYHELSKNLEGAYTGQLANDSGNVVQLVRDQYEQITSEVEMKDTASGNVKVTYYSKCLGDKLEKTTICKGLKIGKNVTFTAEIEVVACSKNKSEWSQTFHISPVGLNEALTVHLDMICECGCESEFELKSPKCSNVGTYTCGICECDEGRSGTICECSRDSHVGHDESSCRKGNSTLVCYGRGACQCGKCVCFERPNKEERVEGDFCDCDNFSCNRVGGQVCGGQERGTCVCGKCDCRNGWTGDACQCRTDNSSCIDPKDPSKKYCNGNGECNCGFCKCNDRFSGPYCEDCPTCPGKCEEFRACVQCQAFGTGELKDNCNCSFVIEKFSEVKVNDSTERPCSFTDASDDCRFAFVYGFDEWKNPKVRVRETKECPPPAYTLVIIFGVIGGIVAIGLCLLLIWKLLTTIHDRREFAKFEKERQMAKWDTGENPIYKQATSTFKNPTYGGKQ